MSGTYVTAAGFVKPTLAEIKTQLEDLFKALGLTDVDPDAPLGQIIGLLSRREALIWDGAEEIWGSRFLSNATGTSLDNLAEELGFYRLPATPTKVEDVILYGSEGTTVPEGSKARLKDIPTQTYSLDTAVTITSGAFTEIQLDPSKGAGVYTIVLDGLSYTVAVDTDAEKDATIDALIPIITAAPKWEATRIDGPKLRIRNKVGTLPGILGSMVGYALTLVGSAGDFTGDQTGIVSCPEGSLNEISTPVSGWTAVYNRQAGQSGRATELDEEFRLRISVGARGGLATELAILTGLYDDVEGLTTAAIVSNRDIVVVNGLPPKSFAVTAVGGTDLAVASSIWRTMPAGIQSFGNVVDVRDGQLGISIQDSQGNLQRIHFFRPIGIYIWIRIKAILSTEELPDTDWQNQIKQVILDQAGVEIKPGKDVVYQNLFKAIYKVKGLDFVELSYGKAASSTATGPDAWLAPHQTGAPLVWVDEKIAISSPYYAAFADARISVEEL